ncbi:MAG: Rho-binding antiterminator [Methylococcaceae bacterium]|jgi:Rho-binding antiterminator|nr:Rho-binding antiterminator [Methylococcaceae bacterium]
MTKQISCNLHDYLEIACMYHYRVKIELKDNQFLEGKAMDIVTSFGREYLIIENDKKHLIELTSLVKLKPLTVNAKFGEIHF